MFSHGLQSILFLALSTTAVCAVLPARLTTRQGPPTGHRWHGGFSPYHGYPGGKGHGTYGPGDFGGDNYQGWHYPHHFPPHGNGTYIDVPSSTPADACPPVTPDFVGFAFEEAAFQRYVQTRNGSVNQYSLNLIDAIMSRTGGKPIVRLGGTSGDYARYIPNQTEPVLPPDEVYTYQDIGGTSIGPAYWDLTHIIPNSVYVVQLPMAHTNVSESVLWAKTASKHIGIDRIEAFEPGNEPDLYPISPELGPPYYQGMLTNATYTGNFTKYVDAVKAAVDIPSEPFFQAFDTSAHLGDDVLATGYILDVQTNFDLGIDAGNVIKQVASHYYQTNGGEYADLGTGLMQHSAIASRLDLLRKFITYLRDNHPTIPYVISEIGNSLNPTHTYDYQAVLGSALWQVDLQLYAMTIGIARLNWQQIMHAGYDMWLPIDSGNASRQTFAPFYAMPFVGDFIGNTGGSTRAVQLDTGRENIPAYAAFVDEKPKRVAIVNLDIWDRGNGTRPSTTFALNVPGDCNEVRVDVLSSPLGAHASANTITYAGSQWTAASDGTEVKGVRNDTRVLSARHGKVEVRVYSSQAVLVHLL